MANPLFGTLTFSGTWAPITGDVVGAGSSATITSGALTATIDTTAGASAATHAPGLYDVTNQIVTVVLDPANHGSNGARRQIICTDPAGWTLIGEMDFNGRVGAHLYDSARNLWCNAMSEFLQPSDNALTHLQFGTQNAGTAINPGTSKAVVARYSTDGGATYIPWIVDTMLEGRAVDLTAMTVKAGLFSNTTGAAQTSRFAALNPPSATITSVALAPVNTTAAAGTTVTYTGTATLSDASTRPTTASDGAFTSSIGAFSGAFGVWSAPGSASSGTITFTVPANGGTGQTLVTATTPVSVVGTRIGNTGVGRVARTLVTMGRRDLRARFSDRPVVRALLGPLNNAVIPVPPTPPASGRVLARSVTD